MRQLSLQILKLIAWSPATLVPFHIFLQNVVQMWISSTSAENIVKKNGKVCGGLKNNPIKNLNNFDVAIHSKASTVFEGDYLFWTTTYQSTVITATLYDQSKYWAINKIQTNSRHDSGH